MRSSLLTELREGSIEVVNSIVQVEPVNDSRGKLYHDSLCLLEFFVLVKDDLSALSSLRIRSMSDMTCKSS